MSSLLIKKGKLVTSAGSSISDILVIDGRIVSIDHDIAESKAERVIDAGSKYVFPGGIDPHVHLHLPAASGFSSDDFLTGSRAALYGGTTALIDFVTPRRGQTLAEALSLRKAEAKSSLTDYSFHVSPVEWTNNTEQEIINCIDEGMT